MSLELPVPGLERRQLPRSPKRPQRRRDTEASRGGSAAGVTGVTPDVVVSVLVNALRPTSLPRALAPFFRRGVGLIAVFTTSVDQAVGGSNGAAPVPRTFSQPARLPVDPSSRTHLQKRLGAY